MQRQQLPICRTQQDHRHLQGRLDDQLRHVTSCQKLTCQKLAASRHFVASKQRPRRCRRGAVAPTSFSTGSLWRTVSGGPVRGATVQRPTSPARGLGKAGLESGWAGFRFTVLGASICISRPLERRRRGEGAGADSHPDCNPAHPDSNLTNRGSNLACRTHGTCKAAVTATMNPRRPVELRNFIGSSCVCDICCAQRSRPGLFSAQRPRCPGPETRHLCLGPKQRAQRPGTSSAHADSDGVESLAVRIDAIDSWREVCDRKSIAEPRSIRWRISGDE